jgi:hypothetical protein
LVLTYHTIAEFVEGSVFKRHIKTACLVRRFLHGLDIGEIDATCPQEPSNISNEKNN